MSIAFVERQDLPTVLTQVTAQVAAQFDGVCQLRFTPAYRPTEARRVIAGMGLPPAVQVGTMTMGDAAYTALLARLGEQRLGHLAPSMWDGHAVHLPSVVGAADPPGPGAILLIAPLIARGRRLGTLDVVCAVAADVDIGHHQQRLHGLAAQAALAIDTADQAIHLQLPLSVGVAPARGVDLEQLLSQVAHDLRNPLASLSTSIQLLVRAAKGPQALDPAKVAHLAEIAEVAVAQLETQISALTPAPAPCPQRGIPSAVPVDLVTLARQLATFYQRTTDCHQLTVVADVAELPGPWAKPHLERVLGNLLTNGIKYSPIGGDIRITVGREEDDLDRWATLSVQDHGIGIPLQDLPQLVQSGYRAGNVGAIPGTGVGLTSVREVVAQYGGTLAIHSVVGACTTIRLRLPLAEACAAGQCARCGIA
ncbi:MAG: HAMP domain-containing histidine kinase [Chloroflexales bacterium]|nr:HAMP domain-containing histidine kinase [Chloroflexales bacterium]